MPYRGGKEAAGVAPAREGLVADMVRQFADPHAFVRELVQNGIDAGATALEIAARFDGERGTFSVTDDGSGMSRDIIEGPLLTLFTSAKDGDDTKIGKYGVGFVSVFAVEPDHIEVETWRSDGEAWILELFVDHRYELRRGEATRRTSPSGTRVTVVKTLDAEGFDEMRREVEHALERWCRHASVPLNWSVERAGSVHRERADRPFEVVAPFSVQSEVEGARVAVGVASGASYLHEGDDERPLAGFYNRGLTLAERRGPFDVVAGVRFKVDSGELSHTLSRDDVRHDDAYHRYTRHVLDVVNGPLRHGLVDALAEAAAGDDPVVYVSLLAAAGPAGLGLAPSAVMVPLCHATGGSKVMSARDLGGDTPVLWSRAPSGLTAALAAEHRPVLRAVHDDVPKLVSSLLEEPVEPVESTYLLVDVVAGSKVDKRLAKEVRRVLEEVGVRLGSVTVARASGTASVRAGYAVDGGGKRHLVHAVAHPRFGRALRRRRLLLTRSHPAVKAATKLARRNVEAAGHLLARYLLVEDRGELGRGLCDDLIDTIGEGT